MNLVKLAMAIKSKKFCVSQREVSLWNNFIPESITEDQFAVGNITGRHHSLPDTFIDHNLPLQGQNSVYGEQVKVVLKGGASVCAVLRKNSMKLKEDVISEGMDQLMLAVIF